MEYGSRKLVVATIRSYIISRGVDYVVYESEPWTFYAKCKSYRRGCDWLVRANLIQKKACWEIQRYNGRHTCSMRTISQDHSKLDSNTIAEPMKSLVEFDPSIKVKSIIAKVQGLSCRRVVVELEGRAAAATPHRRSSTLLLPPFAKREEAREVATEPPPLCPTCATVQAHRRPWSREERRRHRRGVWAYRREKRQNATREGGGPFPPLSCRERRRGGCRRRALLPPSNPSMKGTLPLCAKKRKQRCLSIAAVARVCGGEHRRRRGWSPPSELPAEEAAATVCIEKSSVVRIKGRRRCSASASGFWNLTEHRCRRSEMPNLSLLVVDSEYWVVAFKLCNFNT
ncbi:uncharacterized protein LOC130941217 [Arachis stenosperma]|uniref:uncharacterized protein LOC130941217 n=1 Tax=Arachis stenosperma TaxID=217475 RepID=UPI0025AC991B|nr:uncharacterized protein LOC130941217 [Arachis stenosperma]